jgi:hypothetical protein
VRTACPTVASAGWSAPSSTPVQPDKYIPKLIDVARNALNFIDLPSSLNGCLPQPSSCRGWTLVQIVNLCVPLPTLILLSRISLAVKSQQYCRMMHPCCPRYSGGIGRPCCAITTCGSGRLAERRCPTSHDHEKSARFGVRSDYARARNAWRKETFGLYFLAAPTGSDDSPTWSLRGCDMSHSRCCHGTTMRDRRAGDERRAPGFITDDSQGWSSKRSGSR